MNNMEEILWNYIDGNCTAMEQSAVSKLIAEDETYRLKYQELLNLNMEFAAMELDEPPMAFTYNVMEAVRAEHALKPLKSIINKRIILGIALFFVTTISVLLVYTLANFNWSAGSAISVNIPVTFKMPDVNLHLAKPVVQAFLFLDVVLCLFLFDAWLRKKKLSRQA